MKRLLFICAAIILCHFATVSLWAQNDNYRIGAGDTLSIRVTGEDDLTGDFKVRKDGTMFYSYVKEVPVASRTTTEVTEYLTKILGSDYINSPSVSVTIKDYASKKIQVFGAVKNPGSFTLKGDTRLLDVISLAGGLSDSAGTNILIVRERPKKKPIEAEPAALAIPKTPNEPNPESTPKTNEVVAQQGDTTDKNTPIVVNYSDIVTRGRLESNLLIEPGDVINVPTRDEIFVLGQVNKPGPVKFEDSLTILQAISVAGGPSVAAAKKSTYIIRKDKLGKSEKIEIRLDRIMNQQAENIALMPNDVIVVPESFF